MPTTRHDTRLNYDDFLLLPDDGLRHEIIDGEHYVTPCPTVRHQDLVTRLSMWLAIHVEDRPDRGRVLVSPFDSPSTRRRDQRIKLRLYERSGVREYWMVDPDARAVTIHRRADDRSFPFSACLSADENETLRTPLLPEWSLELSRLFRPLNQR